MYKSFPIVLEIEEVDKVDIQLVDNHFHLDHRRCSSADLLLSFIVSIEDWS